MLNNFLWLLLATIAIQIPNLLSMQKAVVSQLTIIDAAKIALLTLPVTFFATIAYTLFYGNGSSNMSYPAMSIYAKIAALIAAIIVQVYFLKSRDLSWLECFGLALCVVGFVISVIGRN